MRWMCLAMLAACGGGALSLEAEQKHATDRNAHAHDKAHDQMLLDADGSVFQPAVAVVEMTQVALPAGGILGLRPGEALYEMGADGELAIMPRTCIRNGACGCEVSREYTYLKRPDGTVVVARMNPVVREVNVPDACPKACGKPEPELRTAFRLGVRQVSAIRFVEVTYPYDLVVETCQHRG